MLKESGKRQRESVPFTVRTADGDSIELTYSSPRVAEGHDEEEVLESLPWFESGKPLRNYMLHQTDFYDEVEQIWGRRWGAEGIGTLREVLVSRPTENEIRPEYAQEWQYYYSSAAGNADLGRLQAQFDEYYDVLAGHGVRVNYLEAPVPAIGEYGYIKNLVTLAGAGLCVRGGVIRGGADLGVERMDLAPPGGDRLRPGGQVRRRHSALVVGLGLGLGQRLGLVGGHRSSITRTVLASLRDAISSGRCSRASSCGRSRARAVRRAGSTRTSGGRGWSAPSWTPCPPARWDRSRGRRTRRRW